MKNTVLDYFMKKINKDLITKLLYVNDKEIRKTHDILTHLDCISCAEKDKIRAKTNIIIKYFIESNFNDNYKNLMFKLFSKKQRKILLSEKLEEILEMFVSLNCNSYALNVISAFEDEKK